MAMVALRRCLSRGAPFTRESAATGFRSTWGAREAMTACCSWVRAEASARTKNPATTQPDRHAHDPDHGLIVAVAPGPRCSGRNMLEDRTILSPALIAAGALLRPWAGDAVPVLRIADSHTISRPRRHGRCAGNWPTQACHRVLLVLTQPGDGPDRGWLISGRDPGCMTRLGCSHRSAKRSAARAPRMTAPGLPV